MFFLEPYHGPKRNRGGQWRVLREEFFQGLLALLWLVRLLPRRRFGGFLFVLGFPAANQRQRIRGVEGELANRGLAGRAQRDINAAIARHSDDDDVLENPLPLFSAQLRIVLHFSNHLFGGQVVFLAERFGVDVGLRNALFNQEGFDAGDATLGERLIIFHGAAMISVAPQNQVRIRPEFEIFLEISGQRNQRFLLTWHETAPGFANQRGVGYKINAVQGEPGLQHCDLRIRRRRWWSLDHHLGRCLGGEPARVGASRPDRD
jgi:hypothetical protein